MGQSKSDFGFDYKGGEGEAEVQDDDDEGDEGFVVVGDEYRYPHLPHRTHGMFLNHPFQSLLITSHQIVLRMYQRELQI